MLTIDSYVISSSLGPPPRPRRRRAPPAVVAMFAAAAVVAGLTLLGRAGGPSMTAPRAKLDTRIVAASATASRSEDEARIAAFQESAAISHLTPAASAAAVDEPPTAGSGAKPMIPPARKAPQRPAPKSAVAAAPTPPFPQPRPATPEIIMADLPPAARAAPTPAPTDGKPSLLGTIAQGVEGAPGQVQDFAHTMTDRLLGGIADVRVRVGL